MTVDLPTAVRAALRADEIDAHGLRRPQLGAAPPRHRRRRLVSTMAAATAVLLIVAVAGVIAVRRGAAPAANPDTAAFRYVGPVPGTTTIAGGSLLLEPPAGATARLTPAQAYRSLCAAGIGVDCRARATRADMVLALLTTPNSGPGRPDGSLIRPGLLRVLSYVVIWRNVYCPSTGGPAPLPGLQPAPRTETYTCTETYLINADTGKVGGQYLGA